MSQCYCPDCCADPKPTYTPEFRRECEARYVAKLPNNSERKRYLAGVALQRGEAAAQQLRKDAWDLMKRGQVADLFGEAA